MNPTRSGAHPERDVDRPRVNEEERRVRAHELACADLVDALGRIHDHRAHLLDLVTPTPGRILFGPAATVAYFPTCAARQDPDRYNFGALFRQAVADDPEGRVLVLASNGHPDISVGGGTKLGRLEHYGLAGVLTDGRLRDFTELAGYSFAAYCSGETVHAGGSTLTPYLANVPVVLRGVAVHPGDYVFADDAGAVVIPPDDIDQVLAGAAAVQAEDAGFRAAIAQERTTGGASTRGQHEN